MDKGKLEIFYDHYKDTFENQKLYLQRRNLYTLICLVLIAILFFQISSPTKLIEISNHLIKKNIGDIKIDFRYINNVLIFGLFWTIILYYQINLIIEKYYKYIQEIEEKLSSELKPFKITRESKTYQDNYPWLSSVVHRIYTIVFPVTLIIVTIIKWITEKNNIVKPFSDAHFWFDSIFLFGIVLTSLLYLTNRHFNDFKKKK